MKLYTLLRRNYIHMSEIIKQSVTTTAAFEIHVAKETFKFNAAHFVAFEGFRERLHGHNYTVGVRLFGNNRIGADGYLLDFGDVKDVVKEVCKSLNERFLCPMNSDVIDIQERDGSLFLKCQDGALFAMPKSDCALLPIVHATTEELAVYLYGQILTRLGAEKLLQRNIHSMDINVSEAPGQDASFRMQIPESTADKDCWDVRNYLPSRKVSVKPCLKIDSNTCLCGAIKFSNQLVNMADSGGVS
jgi:dihydroneopterin triphosphate aldolase (PTPS-III) / 6-pyruvoyltetrahydropterin synthase